MFKYLLFEPRVVRLDLALEVLAGHHVQDGAQARVDGQQQVGDALQRNESKTSFVDATCDGDITVIVQQKKPKSKIYCSLGSFFEEVERRESTYLTPAADKNDCIAIELNT